jgi:annexin-like protein
MGTGRARPPSRRNEREPGAEPSTEPGAGAPDLLSVATLQRSVGNAAVATLLRADGPRLMRLVTLTADDETALCEQLHDAMAGWGTDERKIYVSLQKLGKDATAIAALKKAYKDKYGDDLEAELRSEMSGEELRLALDLIGIVEDTSKGAMVGSAPTTPEGFKRAAAALYGAMKGWGTDEEAIFAALIPFNRDAASLATLSTTYSTEHSGGLTGKGLEADLNDELSGDELSYALFLLNAPPPRAATGAPGVAAPGTEVHTGKVEGGTVSVRTGTQLTAGGLAEGYSVGYKGGLSDESAWLQFIWREIEVEDPVRGDFRLDQTITTSGGTYKLTTDPDDPHYNTDTASGTDPFYEAAGMSDRTADSSTMYDMPSPMDHLVKAQLAAGATKVTSRAHFNTFLIRDYRAIYRVTVDVEWVFTSAATPPRTQRVTGTSKVDGLPSGIRARLVEQFPKFAYIE